MKTDKVLVFLTVSSLVALLAIYWAIQEDQKRWEEFRKQNSCKQVQPHLWECTDGVTLYK